MTAAQCWELGRRWYAGRLDPDWQPRTSESKRQILADLGLDGEFWRI